MPILQNHTNTHHLFEKVVVIIMNYTLQNKFY